MGIFKRLHFGVIRFGLLAIALFLCPLWCENRFFGYFENRFFLIDQRTVSWSEFNRKIEIADYNRLRLMGKFALSEKVNVNMAVDMFTFHGAMKSPLGISGNNGSAAVKGEWGKIDLDRAYVDLYLKNIDISLGKQRVALGVSYLWAPLDIFNRVNVFEPKAEKPGATALKVFVPIRNKASVTGVFAPETDFSSSTSALRGQVQVANVDIGLTLIRWGVNNTTVWGLDLRGENFIGWWLEGGYFITPEKKDYKVVMGFDTTIPLHRGIYWLNEFFFDSSGESDPAKYDFHLSESGERLTLGKNYLFSSLQYGFSDLLSLSLSYIGNWGDGSYLISPAVQYEIAQGVSLTSGAYFPMGQSDGEFSKNQRNLFFIWLKIYF